jgi:hypothetical protein
MQSTAPSPSVSKTPFFVAAILFAGAAVFISRVSATKLDALELACLGACLAAAGAAAAIPFALAHARRAADSNSSAASAPAPVAAATAAAALSPALDPEALAARVASAVDARLDAALPAFTAQLAEALAALDEKRRAEVLQAVSENPALRPIDSDTVPAAAGKPRLGRGLEGLIRGNTPKTSAPAAPAATADSASDTDANEARAA